MISTICLPTAIRNFVFRVRFQYSLFNAYPSDAGESLKWVILGSDHGLLHNCQRSSPKSMQSSHQYQNLSVKIQMFSFTKIILLSPHAVLLSSRPSSSQSKLDINSSVGWCVCYAIYDSRMLVLTGLLMPWPHSGAMGLLPDTQNCGMFSPAPRVSDPDMHHGTCVTNMPWCMTGSLTGGFLYSRWRGKRSRHSRRMSNLQFYVTGKRPMPTETLKLQAWHQSIIKNAPVNHNLP